MAGVAMTWVACIKPRAMRWASGGGGTILNALSLSRSRKGAKESQGSTSESPCIASLVQPSQERGGRFDSGR